MTSRISNAAAIAACDAIADLMDAGSGSPNLAYIELRTGSQPAGGPDAAATGTLLGTLTCSNPAFGNAADATPGATATANAITSDSSADADGTAGWYRAYDSGGTAIMDGAVSLTSASPQSEMTMDDTAVTTGQTVAVSSWTITVPES